MIELLLFHSLAIQLIYEKFSFFLDELMRLEQKPKKTYDYSLVQEQVGEG